MRRVFVVCSFLFAACAGDATPSPDAGPAARTFGALCDTVTDTSSTECDSQVCTSTIDQAHHNVCSQLCTTDAMCPPGTTGEPKCNMKGYCKP